MALGEREEWVRYDRQRRRAKAREARARRGPKIPRRTRREVMERDGRTCGICGFEVVGEIHLDHIQPVASGGTNDPSNLQVAHPRCNLLKGSAV